MGDQGSVSTMVEIAAARALQWNVDFDRGLRSAKPGAQCEAVMKLGSQLVRWSHNCVVTASSANLFKLEPGQDRVFANAILLRLADTFRSGDNFVRVCILKVLMLELKARGWTEEAFTGDSFERMSRAKRLSPVYSSHSRAVRRTRSGAEGLLTKKRIENHVEMLRRIKCVMDSGDPTSRALAIRVLGCLADLGKDSLDLHNLILQAVHSPHHQEVSAALFAMGCLSELSDDFAELSLKKVFEMLNVMGTPPAVKVLAVRVFANMGHSPLLSLQAHEMGGRVMLRYPMHNIVTTMLISLTILAAESTVIMGSQVDLLLTYLACDPRMNVRAIALKCLGKLIPQAYCCINSTDEIFNGVFAVVQDFALPPPLHVLALRVIQKLFHLSVLTMESGHLVEVISWVELIALREDWSVVSRALSLLVDMVRYVMKYKVSSEVSDQRIKLMDLSTRVCFLLCDQVAVAGGYLLRSRDMILGKPESSLETKEEVVSHTHTKTSTLCVLLVKLMQGCPRVGWLLVDSVAGIMETLAQGTLKQRKLSIEGEEIKMDHISTGDEEHGQGEKELAPGAVGTESKSSRDGWTEVILMDLGHCLSICVSLLELNAKTMEDVHRRIYGLTSALTNLNTQPSPLSTVLQALMKVNLLHESLVPTNGGFGRDQEFPMGNQSSVRKDKLVTETKITLQKMVPKLMEEGSFYMAYNFGKQAALSALWVLAKPAFEGLVDKVNSEGCYFWLRALSYLAMAECVLQKKSTENDGNSELGKAGPTIVVLAGESKLDKDKDMLSDRGDENRKAQQLPYMKESDLEKLSKAAACVLPLLRDSISSLCAGVCLDRIFEFQRWVVTLRLEVLECVSKLVGLLASISTFEADAGVGDVDEKGEGSDFGSLGSALRASMEKVEHLASCLMKLGNEYDLLSMSFMGIDQKSVAIVSRGALFCSLLTFCSVGVLSLQPRSTQVPAEAALNVGTMALDLFDRLQQVESEDWDDLLSFAILNGARVTGGHGFGATLTSAPPDPSLVNICQWAITSVLSLQKQNSLVGVLQGAKVLQGVLKECLWLPWLYPPFFFCTRPRVGVELFLAQAGPTVGDADEFSIQHGSALSLSVCMQIVNAQLDSLVSCKRLMCLFSIQQAESNSRQGDDNVGAKPGFVVHPSLHPALIEKLIQHSKLPTASNYGQGVNTGPTAAQSFTHDLKQLAPDLFFLVPVDSKGQGFASCTLDVSTVPCGDYQLILTCICSDKSGGQWILPLLSTQPILRIT